MKLADAIIRTKINLPLTRPELVVRPRLRERVMEGLAGPLTLITAPAGFGKTTLAAVCVADCGAPAAWLSLDKEDNQPGRFLTYLIAALQAADPRIAADAAQLQSEIQSMPPEVILTSLVNDLDDLKTELVLVLDDYHLITSQAVNQAVGFLLDHCPATFHLVISTRSDPPLLLARLRARGQLVELRSADLRFSEHEAAQFLNEMMGLHLDESSVALLEERTEGWIAGLQMAALSMRDRNDRRGFIETFSGTNRYILDYLLEEVLNSQPPDIQNFLLGTSILNRLSTGLCDAVLGIDTRDPLSPTQPASSAIIPYLERTNLFLTAIDDEGRWFRYHHLFSDLLRSRLAGSPLRQKQAVLHQRASSWFEQNGLVEEAIQHSMAASDYATTARQVEAAAETAWLNGLYAQITAWTKALPSEIVRSRPWLCVWNAWAQTQMGDSREIHQWIEAAEACLGSEGEDRQTLANAIAGLRVFETSFALDYERAITLAESVLINPPSRNSAADDFIRCNLLHLLSSMVYATGQPGKAEQICWETIDLADRIGFTLRHIHAANKLILIHITTGRLASASRLIETTQAFLQQRGYHHYFAAFQLSFRKIDLLYEWNQRSEAQKILDQVINPAKIVDVPYLLVDYYNILAYGCLIQRSYTEAQTALSQAAALARQTYIWEALTWRTHTLQTRLWLETNDLARLRAWINEPLVGASGAGSLSNDVRMLAQARLLLAEGEHQEAIRRLDRLAQKAAQEGRRGSLVEIHLVQAAAWQGQGDRNQAGEALERALALAEPEGYIRAFLDEGQPVQLCLAQWSARAPAGRLRDYARHLLAQFEAEPQRVPLPPEKTSPNDRLIEPLSPRELEVLHHMALGLTNQQIADRLVVARGTVKAQAVSIFRKLDVSNRTEAVARARQLGILT